MKKSFLPLFLVIFLASLSAPAACRLNLKKEATWNEGSSEFWILNGTLQESNSISFVRGPHFKKFQEEAIRKIGNVDANYLIRRQAKIFADGGQPKKVFGNVLKRSNELIKPISCLEGFLMNFFGERLKKPIFLNYSEFGAFVLTARNGDTRIYFQVNPQTAYLPASPHLDQLIVQDIKKGYRLSFHLHNHPFNPGGPKQDIAGTPIPSGEGTGVGDFSAYARFKKDFGMQEARITNGFSTLRVPVKQIPSLLR